MGGILIQISEGFFLTKVTENSLILLNFPLEMLVNLCPEAVVNTGEQKEKRHFMPPGHYRKSLDNGKQKGILW